MQAEDIEVLFFYDSEPDFNHRGVKCEVAEKTSLRSMNVGNNDPSSERLDFVILTIKCPNDETKKESLEKLKPLRLEETSRMQGIPGIRSRLCTIGHPHGAYKHIAFGGLNTDPEGLWRQWETNEVLHGVEHTVATCGGSSGSPVIRFDIKDNSLSTRKIDLPFFPFLHFQGDSKCGDAISGQSILPKIRELIQANTE